MLANPIHFICYELHYDAGADAARTIIVVALKTLNWGAYGMDSKAMIARAVAPYYLCMHQPDIRIYRKKIVKR